MKERKGERLYEKKKKSDLYEKKGGLSGILIYFSILLLCAQQ